MFYNLKFIISNGQLILRTAHQSIAMACRDLHLCVAVDWIFRYFVRFFVFLLVSARNALIEKSFETSAKTRNFCGKNRTFALLINSGPNNYGERKFNAYFK